jgi:hypothetical protein
MSLDGELCRRLLADAGVSALVSDRIFLGEADQGTSLPLVVFALPSLEELQDLDGPTGAVTGTCLVVCIADTLGEAKDLGDAVRASLDGWRDETVSPSIQSFRFESQEDGELPPVDDSEKGAQVVTQNYSVGTQA